MRVLLAGGGTAGHINPAIAIAKYMKEKYNAKVLFIGTKRGLESNLVPAEGYDIEFIEVEGFKRSLTFKNVGVILKTIRAIRQCKRIIKEFKPNVTICTGGYVSGAVMYASHALKVPAMIHEQNVYPGVAVKMSKPFAKYILTSFKETKNHIKSPDKCFFVGNPIRNEILSINKETARKKLNIDNLPLILAFGGSLGAEKLNDAVIGLCEAYKNKDIRIIFGTGSRNYNAVMNKLKEKDIDIKQNEKIQVLPYIYNMHEVLSACDLVISRAGAITISEICAVGRPSVLIPSPNVAHNHQEQNARALEKKKAAFVVLEKDLINNELFAKVDYLINNKKDLAQMSENARKMGVVDATQKICDKAHSIAVW